MTRLFETEAFVCVVDEGSFRAASERLEVSKSYVSKLVTRLEDRLGVRLLHRTTRRLSLTDAGQRFYQECAAALRSLQEAEERAALDQRALTGRLRVSLPTGLGLQWLTHAMAAFACAHPGLRLEVAYLDRRVDLVSEGFDVAIRAGVLPDSSLIARRLAWVRRMVVASPTYLAKRGAPNHPSDLADMPCLTYSYSDSMSNWDLVRGDEQVQVRVGGPMVANHGAALAEAAALGLGITYLPEFHVARALASGDLVHVLPEWGATVPVNAIYPTAEHVPRRVRAFVDFFVDTLAELPWSKGPD